MTTMISTKITKGGQTTVPREIRDALGIAESSRVYWTFDGTRATLSAELPLPNEVHTEEEFWEGIELAMRDVADGRTRDAQGLAADLRAKYGL